MLLLHIGYIEYCENLKIKINISDLDTTKIYYWHSNYSSDVFPVTFLRINGNTFIFQIIKSGNKIGLSSENGIIYGITTDKYI